MSHGAGHRALGRSPVLAGGAEAVQVATAVGVPVKRGKVAKLANLRRAVGGQLVLVLPCPTLTVGMGAVLLLLPDKALRVVVAGRHVTVVVGDAEKLTVLAPLILFRAGRGVFGGGQVPGGEAAQGIVVVTGQYMTLNSNTPAPKKIS